MLCRSMAESYAPPDWKSALTGRQFERSGMQAYGAAKLFNIMLAKEYSKRLKVWRQCLRIRQAHLSTVQPDKFQDVSFCWRL